MIQRDQGALARPILTQNRIIRPPNKLIPVPVHGTGEPFHQRVRYVVEECGVGVEPVQSLSLQLQTFAFEISGDKVEDLVVCWRGAVQGGKILEDVLRRFVGRFVYEGLRVRVKFCNVHGLQQLCEGQC